MAWWCVFSSFLSFFSSSWDGRGFLSSTGFMNTADAIAAAAATAATATDPHGNYLYNHHATRDGWRDGTISIVFSSNGRRSSLVLPFCFVRWFFYVVDLGWGVVMCDV